MEYCGPRGIAHGEFLTWDEDDQAKAIAWMMEDRERCPECGTRAWEWEADEAAYTADFWLCRGCQQRETLATRFSDATEFESRGMKVHLFKGSAS